MTRSDARSTRSLLGVVLAGGGSRRFGSPKPLASFRGARLWERAADRLAALELPLIVVANDPAVVSEIDADVRGDLRVERGPLAGIETGLVEASARGMDGVLVLACDLVLVDRATLATLVEAWPGSGAAAFEASGPWGVAPLCSVWGVDLLPAVEAALDAGRGSPGELLLEVRLERVVPAPGPEAERRFRSANRPEELLELAAALRPHE